MKKILLILSLFITVVVSAKDRLDLGSDFFREYRGKELFLTPPPITNGIYNIQSDGGATGVNGTNVSTILQTAFSTCSNNAYTLYMPAGTYTSNSPNIDVYSGLYVKGDNPNNTIININSNFTGNSTGDAVIRSSGKKNWRFENIQFKGDAKHLRAFIQINSYTDGSANMCPNIEFINCIFDTIWATDGAVRFGDASGTNVLDRVVDPLFLNCKFFDIRDPAHAIAYGDTTTYCHAINFNSTTDLGRVLNCNFQRISGDGIFQYGWSLGATTDTIATDPQYGGLLIQGNSFMRCRMGVEQNGNGLPIGIRCINNYFFDWTHNGGFGISINCKDSRVEDNDMRGFDRAAIEISGVNWTVLNNHVSMSNWTSTCGGTKCSQQQLQQDMVEAYGFNGVIDGGFFRWEINGTKDASSPTYYTGISFVTTNQCATPHQQPEQWDNLLYGSGTSTYGYAGNFHIRNCLIQGYTQKAVYDEMVNQSAPSTRYTFNVFIEPTVTCSSTRCTGNTIVILGFNWHILCKIDNTGSPTIPTTGGTPNYGAVAVNSYQAITATGSVVQPNIVGSAWKILNQDYYISTPNVNVHQVLSQ